MREGLLLKIHCDKGTLHIMLPEKINATTVAAFEKELFAIEQLNEAEEIILDADNLSYIASLGLRVLLKLKKRCKGTSISIVNTDDAVYKVFEDTGFAKMLKVTKKLRFVDIDSLEVLGAGYYGSVYRINEEQILKVFYNVQSEQTIHEIINTVRIAFTHGIPTIIPFEVVRTAKGLGVVLELLNAKIMSTLMHDNPKDFDKYVIEMVELAKMLADTTFEEGTLNSHRTVITSVVESAAAYLTPEEIVAIKKYIDLVPHRNSGVHGDFHARNIMIMDGSPLLIDMDEFGCGHPIWDLGGTYRIYQLFPHVSADLAHKLFDFEGITFAELYLKIFGLTLDEADHFWEKFFNEYFKDYSDQDKVYLAELVKVYGALCLIFPIARYHLKKDDPERLAVKIDVIRYLLKEMQAVDFDHLIKAFEVFK